jgi:L-ascorbate metabolism protein UlaG (beta-lactamase superfamily)
MGFEDLLRKKLGPMRDLVSRAVHPDPPGYDPAKLWYRRAVGLEIRARPEETWTEVEIGRLDAPDRRRARIDLDEAALVAGLVRFEHAESIEAAHRIRPADLWRLVERDLLFFATTDPKAPLAGTPNVLSSLPERGRVARARSVWPTVAVETLVQIAPMPFMPRAADLERAELAGVRFASLERGFEVLGVTITGATKTGRVLRRLIPLLDGRCTPDEILREIGVGDRDYASKMLVLLDRLALLEARAAPPDPAGALESPARAQVTFLGHAAALVQTAGKSILVDPLFFSASDPPARDEAPPNPPKPDPRALPAIDAVLITHGDNDHLNANTLLQIPTSTPIYIPRIGERPPPFQVDMRRMLEVLGFARVIELETWAGVAIGDVVVTACPFVGESWDLPLAKSTYLVESDEAAFYFAADSAPMDDVHAQIAARARRTVDLAFMGVSGCAETFVMPDGFGYGNFYRDWVPRVRHNEWVKHCAGPEDAARSLAILRPRFAFGYAAGGASWIRTEYSDTGDHDQMAAAIRRMGLATKPVALPIGRPVPLAALGDMG